MNRRRPLSIVVALLLAVLTVSAQDDSPRQMLEQAEEAYQIGRILEAKKLAEDCVKRLDDALRLSGYRLLSLCCLALDQQDDARRYAELVLEENPYYTPTIDYPPRFVDMINDIKQGFITTISTASNQSESVNEAPVPITIITAEMIEELGYNKNLNQILAAYVPGMAEIASNKPGENLAMHGAYAYGQELILIMENGHRLNSRFNNIGTTSYSVSLEKIDHIEVLRGPASSLYGNVALSAVVNIITKSGRDINGIKARYGYGSYNTHRADLLMGTQFMDADISAWASLYKSDGQIRHFKDGEGYYKEHASPVARYFNFMIKSYFGPDKIYVDSYRDTPSYDIGFALRLKGFNLQLSHKSGKKLFQTTSYSGYDYSRYNNVNGLKPGNALDVTHAEIGYSRQLGKISLNASLYGDWYSFRRNEVMFDSLATIYYKYDDNGIICDGEGNEVYEIEEAEGSSNYESFKENTVGGLLKIGTDYRIADMRGNLLVGCQFERFSAGSRLYFNGDDEDLITGGSLYYEDLELVGKENILSLFVQDKHYFTPQLILNAGLRYDQKSQTDDVQTTFSPRLALMYVPNDRFSLKLSYAEAFADLALFYRYLFKDAFELSPQRLSALQLTAMGKVAPWHLNYEINLFYNHFINLPCWVRRKDNESIDMKKSVNNGQMKNVGIEATARYNNQRLSCGLNLYYCHIVSCDNYYYNSIEKKVTSVPHFTMGLFGAYKLFQTARHELKAYGYASYIGRQLNQTDVMTDDYYLKAQALFDLGIKYCYRQRLNISLDCENLLNSDRYVIDPISDKHPIFQRGRNLMASVAYTF
jgi:iron complex outermembrane receptor protein